MKIELFIHLIDCLALLLLFNENLSPKIPIGPNLIASRPGETTSIYYVTR